MSLSHQKVLQIAATTVIIITAAVSIKKEIKRRKRVWTKKWLEQRNEGRGILHMLNNELLMEDSTCYRNFVRLSHEKFEFLLALVEDKLKKVDTVMRESIPARNRLEVTLRFLATGESFQSLMYSTRIHQSTISKIIPEVLSVLINSLSVKYLKIPSTEEWKEISKNFEEMWQFPHCLGALDGRHIQFRPPRTAGSYYYNYKGNHSIVLLALADANYKFIYVNIGVNGRVSDGGVFQQSSLGKSILNKTINFPLPETLSRMNVVAPYVIIADDAFPLNSQIMKPYPARALTHEKKIFNYRLSRARRMVESSFGILANRFRVLLNPINLSVEKVEKITLACVLLHNFLAEGEKLNGNGYLGNENEVFDAQLRRIGRQVGDQSFDDARLVRQQFTDYFCTIGAVPWQDEAIKRHNL